MIVVTEGENAGEMVLRANLYSGQLLPFWHHCQWFMQLQKREKIRLQYKSKQEFPHESQAMQRERL